jgi:hypothetical protein
MWTAIIVIVFVFVFVVGGIMGLLKSKGFKLPDDYDPDSNNNASFDDDDS